MRQLPLYKLQLEPHYESAVGKGYCFLPSAARRIFLFLNARLNGTGRHCQSDTLEAPADFTILLLLASVAHTAPYTGVMHQDELNHL